MVTRKQKAGSQVKARVGWLPSDPRLRRNAGAEQTVYRKAKYVAPLDLSVQQSMAATPRADSTDAKVNAIIAALVASELMDGAP